MQKYPNYPWEGVGAGEGGIQSTELTSFPRASPRIAMTGRDGHRNHRCPGGDGRAITEVSNKMPRTSMQLQAGVDGSAQGAGCRLYISRERQMPGQPAGPQHVALRDRSLTKGFRLAIAGWGSLALQWGGRDRIQVLGDSFSSTKTRRQ